MSSSKDALSTPSIQEGSLRIHPDPIQFFTTNRIITSHNARPVPNLLPHLKALSAHDQKASTDWFSTEGPRQYRILGSLGEGDRGFTFHAEACLPNGEPIQDALPLVVKIPRIDLSHSSIDPDHPGLRIQAFLGSSYIRLGEELVDIQAKVEKCRSANPIIDLDLLSDIFYLQRYQDGEWKNDHPLEFFFSVQLQLKIQDGYFPISDYITSGASYLNGKKNETYALGQPISDPGFFLKLTQISAKGLRDLHIRRIKHGDVWPPNMFIFTGSFKRHGNSVTLNGDEVASLTWKDYYDSDFGANKPIADTLVFIDFGESWDLQEPESPGHPPIVHAYAAPELATSTFAASDASDVYSFGIFLFWLAAGASDAKENGSLDVPIPIPHRLDGNSLRWEERDVREFIRDYIAKKNPSLCKKSNWIIDLIVRCTCFDQADRPRMTDIVRELELYQNHAAREAELQSDPKRGQSSQTSAESRNLVPKDEVFRPELEVQQASKDLSAFLSGVKGDSGTRRILESLIGYRVKQLSDFTEGLDGNMVDVVDSRDALIGYLVRLYEALDQDTTLMSISLLNVWQKHGYGHDGRYMSANLEALKRGVGIARVFCVSVEELGERYVTELRAQLDQASRSESRRGARAQIGRLMLALDSARSSYIHRRPSRQSFVQEEDTEKEMRRRLELVLASYVRMSERYAEHLRDRGQYSSPEKMFHSEPISTLPNQNLRSFFLGLRVFPTAEQAIAYRMARLRTIIHRRSPGTAPSSSPEWLLVESSFRGRQDTRFSLNPELSRLRIFVSSNNPPIALKSLSYALGSDPNCVVPQDEPPGHPINIGLFVKTLCDCVEKARTESDARSRDSRN